MSDNSKWRVQQLTLTINQSQAKCETDQFPWMSLHSLGSTAAPAVLQYLTAS